MNERMNNKIKELELLCYEECGDYHLGSISMLNTKKLAELIVRECVVLSETYYEGLSTDDPECFTCRKVAYTIADRIKEHFGVE
jgi:hypothetical protein